MSKSLPSRIIKIVTTHKSLAAPQKEIVEIKELIQRSKLGSELISPLNQKIKDFFARHIKLIQKTVKRKRISVEVRYLKMCIVEYILVDNFTVVYSKYFEESTLNARQMEFDAKLAKCRDLPKECWCNFQIDVTSFDWLNIIEAFYSINQFHSPFDKLISLKTAMNESIKLVSKGKNQLGNRKGVSSDDLMPVLIYAIVTSSTPLLLINISYIDNFLPDEYMCEEEGYCLTTLLLAAQYVETVDLDKLAIEFKKKEEEEEKEEKKGKEETKSTNRKDKEKYDEGWIIVN